MNITTNVHFTLPVDCYNDEGELERVEKSLHDIPHCCLGEFSGFEALHLFAFFPKLALHPDGTTTFLTDKQQSLWVDSVFLPALYGEYEGEDGLLQHFPGSYETAKANALSHSTEQSTYDHKGLHLPRQQLIRHFIQPEKLSRLWDRVLEAIQGNPELLDFQGVVLYAAAKDLKSRYISTSLSTVCSRWERQYTYAVDAQFHTLDRAFVDLGKQVTAQGSYLYPSPILDGREPQSFLYKRCCLESFFQWFCEHALDQDGKKEAEEPNNLPIRHLYTTALTRDAANMTLEFPIGSINRKEGHIYSQFYSEVQAPFNAAKAYPFENTGYESLAIDPTFWRLQHMLAER
jgi:hypothetical protein